MGSSQTIAKGGENIPAKGNSAILERINWIRFFAYAVFQTWKGNSTNVIPSRVKNPPKIKQVVLND